MNTEFFEAMFKQHSAIMMLLDPATDQIIDSNETASRFYGYTPAQLNGMTMADITRLSMAQRAELQEAAMREERNYAILPHWRASGEKRIVEVHASPMMWHNKPLLFSIIHDITEHQRAEEALRESELKMKTLFELLPVGISVLNRDNKISYMNPALEKIWQMSAEGLRRGDYQQRRYFSSDGTPMSAEQFASHRAIQEQRAIYNVETGVITEDNQLIWTNVSAVPVSFADWQVIIVSDNITEHKQAQDKLITLTQAIEQSSSSVVVTDVMTQIEFVNHGFTQITGYTRAEVAGKNYYNLQSAFQSAQFYQNMQESIHHNGTWRGEIMNKRKNGELYWELAQVSAIKNNQNKVTHYVAISDDITNRKVLEIELHLANHQLMASYDETLQGWVSALDLRDKETEGHSLRVTEMTVQLAQLCGISERELQHIRRGALLHDIGKLGIPDNILLKAGPLDETEWQIMKLHPVYAYQMLRQIKYLEPVLAIPYCHHEKWDGTGYPRGLKGTQIPMAARLFAMVDVWDALSSNRPYRLAWPKEKVINHILSLAGSHFEPHLVLLFLQLVGVAK